MDYKCLVFTLVVYPFSSADFAEIPSSVIVELGMTSPSLRCRHNVSDAFITWRVNGSSVGQFPDIRTGFINESGNIVDTLTIPAELQYNGTVVECVAAFFNGPPSEVTPEATIIFVPANLSTIVPVNFMLVPSPLTVAMEQGTATFQCQHSLADDINWLLNGTSLNSVHLFNVSSSVQFNGRIITYILFIGTRIEYNQTTIECEATFTDGSPSQFTAPVVLLIQDTPGPVKNAGLQRYYQSKALIILWDPLPTLDINGTDPDIVYNVDLYRITCDQNIPVYQTVVAGNSTTEEGLDMMQIYKVLIATRNNVRKAKIGPSVVMEEAFLQLNGSTLFNLARYSRITVISLDPVPSFYEIFLESLDGHARDVMINITVHRDNEIISITMEDILPSKLLWNASVLAYGCEFQSDSHTSESAIELSTHDIQNVTVNSPLPGQIRVTGEFVNGSTATGVLLIVYSMSSNDIHYIAKEKEWESIFDVCVNHLSGTQYEVAVFSLENHLPFPRVVSSPKLAAVANSNQRMILQLVSMEYELCLTSTGVCITCTFLDNSATNCVAVVHQRISQLNSSGLTNIESSHKFNRFGDTAYGCIEGVNLEQYQVGVIGGNEKHCQIKKRSKPTGSSVCGLTCSIISATALIVVLLLLVVCIALVITCRIRRYLKSSSTEIEADLELQKCSAYEIVNLSRQRVEMETNPAYGEVGQFHR